MAISLEDIDAELSRRASAGNDREIGNVPSIEDIDAELVRRGAVRQDQPNQGVLGAVGVALGSRPELQPYGQAGIPEGGFGPLEAAGQTLAAPIRVGQTIAGGPNMLGEATSEGLGYASAKMTPNPSPMAQKIADYGAATAGMMVANAPFMAQGGQQTKYSTELAPASGKPGIAARIKQTRTGVEASNFERLRRDPMAFFEGTDRGEAGKDIGRAKVKADINLGVTDDIKSLTSENISKARNLQGSANKAQDNIIARLDEASKVRGSPLTIVTQAKITPDEVSTALQGVNKRLAKLERTEGTGSPSFQQWSAIKTHFQNMLEEVAPDVRQANQDFSRVALRDKFMEPFPVNQSGTMSKISAFGGAPLAGGVGALIGGGPGAIAAGVGYQALRSPFVAGLGTAVRGLADKALDPLLTGAVRGMSNRVAYASFIDKITTGKQ